MTTTQQDIIKDVTGREWPNWSRSQGIEELVMRDVRALFAKRFPEIPPEQACLYWSYCVQSVLADHFIRSIIVAGTAQFQYRSDAEANGGSTHYSYIFDPMAAAIRWNKGLLPELHCWVVTEDNEIIDPTTRFQIEREQDEGMDWSAPVPPDYLWYPAKEIPYPRFNYCYHPIATMLALMAIDQLIIKKGKQ